MANVMVVDDDKTARRAVRRMLTNLGHEVRVVGDGAEALQLLDGVRFDLVITDVYMECVDGMELLVRIHQRGLNVPVVAISGGGCIATDEILAMARACGAAATLDKPFTPQQLRDTVEPLLRQAPRA
ncbi:MAG TPA: response regulator [Streptosporangiaceae bacterium]|nr:response regulator [Streptosporangiaceae bacterium]